LVFHGFSSQASVLHFLILIEEEIEFPADTKAHFIFVKACRRLNFWLVKLE
jgi:hypothetical protein